MSLRSTILCAACLAAVVALSDPAFADFGSGFSATFQGDYSHINADIGGASGNADVWGGEGSGAYGLGTTGIKLQVDGGYQEVDVSNGGGDVDNWNIDGAFIWRGGRGRLGATAGYDGLSADGANGHVTSYGGFAEWFAGHMFTFGVKGGGASGSGDIGGGFGFNGTGTDIGGEAVFYVVPDLALNANVDYVKVGSVGNAINYGGTIEWLVSESVPVSVYGGYSYTDLSHSAGHFTTWLVGLKFYLNSDGASTLADRQRNGNANWGTESNLVDTLLR